LKTCTTKTITATQGEIARALTATSMNEHVGELAHAFRTAQTIEWKPGAGGTLIFTLPADEEEVKEGA
jgi:hypothetical protein